jgi:hypothetical protein
MPDAKAPDAKALGIVHVTRAPVGGIFRHIVDVASGQAARGHRVGLVCDAMLKKLWVLPVDIRLSAHSNKLRFRPRSYSYLGNVPVSAASSAGASTSCRSSLMW